MGAVWCKPKWYAARQAGGRLKKKTIYMHREILNPGPGLEVDHRNGDGLDNQRENIRIASHAQNQANRPKASHNTSGFKGVRRGRNGHGWQAVIVVNGRAKYLGQHGTREEAARVYDRAAVALLGEFAQINRKDN